MPDSNSAVILILSYWKLEKQWKKNFMMNTWRLHGSQ